MKKILFIFVFAALTSLASAQIAAPYLVPTGGTSGQFIKKMSATEGDFLWADYTGSALLTTFSGGTFGTAAASAATAFATAAQGATADAAAVASTTAAALALKAPLASPAFTGTPTGITAAHVGLGNVTNTSDANKPVSTAQQTALDLKAPLASPTFTGTVNAATVTASGAVTGSNLSGTNTGDQTTVTGNAGTATTLQTARTINGTSFNGSANITVTASADTLTGATLPALSGVNLTALNATNLGSGTVPDARFPATLPAASGVNLTALNGTNISSGTVADARIATPLTGKTLTTAIVNNQSLINNYSTASQAPAAATRTYLTGSAITVPAGKLQIGTRFRWTFDITKTAAGTAASTYDIAIGTAGTTADTARVSFTKPAGTAVVDTGKIVIECIIRGPLSASGIAVGTFSMTHNLASTGHATIPAVNVVTVSSAFDVTTANLIVGICATTGASDAITIQSVSAESWNL